ncbi:hypothetical protein [Streptantibioticus ferralitis]|uniref:Uncharacterized protein n=1 Tax=Streptantibioticus ferralitis TaxID=236510 RepID=A0ABT5YXC0_9ACTN|nr:hypothetical protein [Streptantibioticus ferralitis]MDF2256123.1 hypothetical protein [Streptantibioticus ferralitis]
MAGGLLAVFALMSALPKRAPRHADEPVAVNESQDAPRETTDEPALVS